ncbi:MAG: class I tRNA ligase family protein, partial [Phycisphaerae bacterium]
ITLWVSRMVMMGQYALGDIPFADVFIHAMIQDGQGRKMSKSLGNGIDPLTISDSHGADAMRFTLVSMTTQTQDVRMPVEEMTLPDGRKANTSPKFDQGRNFCNKLWNASRFTMMNLAGAPPLSDVQPHANISDAWILSRYNSAIRDATRALGKYRYNDLGETLYHFMWDDFCDWYLEIAKARINAGEDAPRAILAYVLDGLLRLLHPVVPFITEIIWQKLNEVAPRRGASDRPAEGMLVRASWPRADAGTIDETLEQRFATLQQIIREVRNIRTQHNIPRSRQTDVVVEAAGRDAELLADNAELIRSQASVGELTVEQTGYQPPADAAAATVGTVKVYVLGAVDRTAELKRLDKEAEKLRKAIDGAEKKLANENFVNKAPAEVVQQQRDRLDEQKAQLSAVEDALEKLR